MVVYLFLAPDITVLSSLEVLLHCVQPVEDDAPERLPVNPLNNEPNKSLVGCDD